MSLWVKAHVTASLPHFRFTPGGGHRPSPDRCPFRADFVAKVGCKDWAVGAEARL